MQNPKNPRLDLMAESNTYKNLELGNTENSKLRSDIALEVSEEISRNLAEDKFKELKKTNSEDSSILSDNENLESKIESDENEINMEWWRDEKQKLADLIEQGHGGITDKLALKILPNFDKIVESGKSSIIDKCRMVISFSIMLIKYRKYVRNN